MRLDAASCAAAAPEMPFRPGTRPGRGLRILMVAPQAPPKNSPEAVQVGRYLAELAPRHRVILATTPPETGGWVRPDPGLALPAGVGLLPLRLPLHRPAARLLGARCLAALHAPDATFWLRWMAGAVRRGLACRPDVVYSRSFPLAAALLGRALKARLGLPWLMHLSDPWADNPYRRRGGDAGARDAREEAACFAAADAVTVTTERLRAFYAAKYPGAADRIAVSPNVMPTPIARPAGARGDAPRLAPAGRCHLVHTGAFYAHRRPTALLAALRLLAARDAAAAGRLKLWFAGNMSAEVAAEIRACAPVDAVVLGPVAAAEARALQAGADVLLAIEPAEDGPLAGAVLLSKMVDYLAARRPILALTPPGSVSDEICRRGFGWAADPADVGALAARLGWLAGLPPGAVGVPEALPAELEATGAARRLEALLHRIAGG